MKLAVFAGLSMTIVDATSHTEAKKILLKEMGLDHKSWLANGWRVRVANTADLDRWAAQAPQRRRAHAVAQAEDDRARGLFD